MDSAVRVLSESFVVRDHANGRTASVKFFEQLHHRFAVARIQVSGWLIG